MNRIIVIGIDGFDPVIVRELIAANKLPGFAALAESGTLTQLQTANPAQSPVVWTSIATGTHPGNHGLFDFIARDPETHLPYLAITKPNKKNILGLRAKQFIPVQSATPFWRTLTQYDITTTVLKWPVTFPPESINGNFLSGLGVPDISGTLGRYTLYTTDPSVVASDKGTVILVEKAARIHTVLNGPEGLTMPLFIKSQKHRVVISIAQQDVLLEKGTWSNWISVTFKKQLSRTYPGMVKFFVRSINPLHLYVTAPHVDPKKPLFQISYPDAYATSLATAIGQYHTLGMPEEANGLMDNHLTLDAFFDLVTTIQKERETIFWHEFEKFQEGVFAFVFDTIDRVQHMFWFTRDRKHPLYTSEKAKKYATVITDFYQQLDTVVGKVINAIDEATPLLVISDHGFGTFRRSVHINRWLISQGFMALKEQKDAGGELFADVDWSRTAAYALGFSSIYLNKVGREKHGIVPADKEDALLADIQKKLLQLYDHENKTAVFHRVYPTKQLYPGNHTSDGPDMIVGTCAGYRASWQTAVGAAPLCIVEDNQRQWCGDHLVDPSFVPGVLASNRKISAQHPSVYDIAPTILQFLGVPNSTAEGSNLL